jgi:hypothetical protein
VLPLVRTLLLVPVATAAGFVALQLTELWNAWAGAGGAVVVGCASAYLVWLVDRHQAREKDEGA